ncbi:MAG: O-antigen ligase family protein [Solirubrobacterales bacterium]
MDEHIHCRKSTTHGWKAVVRCLVGALLLALFGAGNAGIELLAGALIVTIPLFRFWPQPEKGSVPRSPTFWSVVLLILLALPILPFFAVNRSASLEWLLLLSASLVFVSVLRRLHPDGRYRLIQGLAAITSAVALLSLAASVRDLPLLGDWTLLQSGTLLRRLSGPFGYPNALGILLGAVWLAFPYASNHNSHTRWTRLYTAVAPMLLAAGLILTFSRGAWISVLTGLAVAVWLRGPSETVRTYSPSLLFGLVTAYLTASVGLPGLLSGGILTGLVAVIFESQKRPGPSRWFWLAGTLAGVGFILLWPDFAARLFQISPAGFGRDLRFEYWRTAGQLIALHPFGAGFGAWPDIYPQVQRVPFFSETIHNAWLEMILGLGWAALIPLFGLLFSWMRSGLIQHRKRNQDTAFLTAAAASLLVHAFADSDWIYFSLWLLLLLFLTLAEPGKVLAFPGRSRVTGVRPMLAATGGLAFLVLVFLAVSRLLTANPSPEASTAVKQLTLARTLNPVSAQTRIVLAENLIELAQRPAKSALAECAAVELERALLLRRNSDQIHASAAQGYVKLGDYAQALLCYQRAAHLAPNRPEHLENAILTAYQQALSALDLSQKTKARRLLNWVVIQCDLAYTRNPAHPPYLLLLRGQAWAILGDYQAAADSLMQAAKTPELVSQVNLWRLLVRSRRDHLSPESAFAMAPALGLAPAEYRTFAANQVRYELATHPSGRSFLSRR